MEPMPSLKQIYEQRRLDNKIIAHERKQYIYSHFPAIKEVDMEIKSNVLAWGRAQLLHQPDSDKETLHLKNQPLIAKRDAYLKEAGYPANYLEPVYTCPICKDQGYLNGKHCICYKQLKADLLFAQSPIRKQLEKENFSTFNLSLFSDEIVPAYGISPRDNMKQALAICKQFVKQFPKGQNLLFQGNTGVGKTFLTNCIASDLIRSSYTVTYLTAHQFFQILADFSFHRKNEEQYHFIFETDLLIIDDLGTELNNGFIDSALFDCINDRFINEKSTIISTNKSLKQLEQNYSKRVTSRLIEHYKILPIFGPDLRIMKNRTSS